MIPKYRFIKKIIYFLLVFSFFFFITKNDLNLFIAYDGDFIVLIPETIFLDPANPPFVAYFSFFTHNILHEIGLTYSYIYSRIPTFLFSVLTLSVFFIIMKKFFGIIIGFFSTSFFFISLYRIYSLKSADSAYFFIFFSVLSFYLFYKSVMLGDKKNMWFLVLCSLLMAYISYLSFFIFVVQLLFILFGNIKFSFLDNKKYIITFFIFFIPVLLHFIESYLMKGIGFSNTSHLASNYVYNTFSGRLFYVLSFHLDFFSGLLNYGGFHRPIIIFSYVFMFFLGFIYLVINRKKVLYAFILFHFLILFFYIVLILLDFPYRPHYIFHFSWIFFMTIALSFKFIIQFFRFFMSSKVSFLVISLIFVLLSVFNISNAYSVESFTPRNYFYESYLSLSKDFENLLLEINHVHKNESNIDFIVFDKTKVEHSILYLYYNSFFILSDIYDVRNFLRDCSIMHDAFGWEMEYGEILPVDSFLYEKCVFDEKVIPSYFLNHSIYEEKNIFYVEFDFK